MHMNYLKRKRNSYKAISDSSLRGTSATTDQNVPPRQHLQRIQRKIHPGQEVTIIPPRRHIVSNDMHYKRSRFRHRLDRCLVIAKDHGYQ